MKKAPFCNACFVSAVILVLALTSGCRILPGISDGSDEVSGSSVTSISGKVLRPASSPSMRSGVKLKVVAADLSGMVEVPGAAVWIEDIAHDLRYHTISDASGSYRINDVPPGEHRIVTSIKIDGVIMKYRSDVFNVDDTARLLPGPQLPLETAKNIVTGQLCDTEGKFLPENTVLTLGAKHFQWAKTAFLPAHPCPIAIWKLKF